MKSALPASAWLSNGGMRGAQRNEIRPRPDNSDRVPFHVDQLFPVVTHRHNSCDTLALLFDQDFVFPAPITCLRVPWSKEQEDVVCVLLQVPRLAKILKCWPAVRISITAHKL